jgi:phospholipid/cholesterol/gamma-HCH transport system substrate-binding protein
MTTSKWVRPIGFLLTMVVVVAGLAVMFKGGEPDRLTVTAHFPKAVGLYPGSSVRVLGVKVGTVRSITPDGPDVRVVLDLPRDTPIPADATAVIIPPSLVSDRYVELTPVYGGGDRMADGAVIDADHTMTPVELDEILGSLDSLLVALGPKGANADGSLARLVDVGAKTLGKGGGKDFHDTIVNLAQAVRTLSDNRGDVSGVIENLAAFTHTLARNDQQIRVLTRDLAEASRFLAGERRALAEALKNLSVALGEIASLVREHKATLGADIKTLSQVTAIVVKHKKSLIEALDVLPLGATNIASTINTEVGTLDIRNNNHQGDNPDVVLCQLLGINCPPESAARGGDAAKRPESKATTVMKAKASEAERVTDELSLRGLWGPS